MEPKERETGVVQKRKRHGSPSPGGMESWVARRSVKGQRSTNQQKYRAILRSDQIQQKKKNFSAISNRSQLFLNCLDCILLFV